MLPGSQTFATATPDFTGSIYSSHDLDEARLVFNLVFERYAPGWNSKSAGVLARLWSQDARPAVEQLIDIARVLFEFSGGITNESIPALDHKIRLLLACKDQPQFDELLAELRVGALLAVRAGPVACEPLSRPLDYKNSTQSRSPDFAIRLPESDILIEVTTLRIGALDKWERAMEVIRERIREAVVGAGMAKEVEIHAPLKVSAHALTRRVLDHLLKAMKQGRDGAINIEFGPVVAKVIWREIAYFQAFPLEGDQASLGDYPFPSKDHFSAVFGPAGSVPAASASKIVLVIGPNVDELFVNSIRNTVDAKRTQFTVQAPSLLILQPGAWRISPDYVQHLVEKRLWPNSQYAWLTGIGILQPRRSFEAAGRTTTLTVTWNPSPKEPRTPALNDLVEANAWFSKGLRIQAPNQGFSR